MQHNITPRSRRSRLALLAGVVLALALVLGACSSSKTSNADITIKDFAYTVKAVKAGATVTVHNNGPSQHTVSADNGEFDVTIDSGKDATFTAPTKPGTYKFHCNIHPTQMTATLTVT